MDYSKSAIVAWIKGTGERAGKTFVQVFVLQMIAAGWFTVDGIQDISTPKRAGLAALGAGLSVISSALSSLFGNSSSPSLVDEHPVDVHEDVEVVDIEDPGV